MGDSDTVQAVLEKARLRRVAKDNPLLADLPSWVIDYRPHQVDAVTKLVGALERSDLCVLDAPTGSGKTLIAETVRRLGRYESSIYICSSKGLQDQFQRDFPYAKVLKGRRNYPTELYPGRFEGSVWNQLSCGDCTRTKDSDCRWCNTCPYDLAKIEALRSPLAVLNTSYFLSEANGPGRFSSRSLCIFDEADTLEKELMSYVSCSISRDRARKYGINPPPTVTSRKTWPKWLDETLAKLREERLRAKRHLLEVADTQTVREFTSLDRWVYQLQQVSEGVNSDLWVFTGRDDHIEFKPVSVSTLGDKLWSHGRKFLLMSATVISPETLVRELGWDTGYEVVTLGNTFPPSNRPIYVKPVVGMTSKTKDVATLAMITAVREVVAKHPGERVLIHCVSYELGRALACGLVPSDRSVLTYGNSSERDRVVESFKKLEGSVLVAPSLERGIDLPDDLCRVQIIAKVPFPYLGDRQISARLHSPGGQGWYTVSTVRSIVQSTGRGVRHDEDWAVSYILDSQFVSNVWGRNRNLFPTWWREAMIWIR